MKPSSQITIHPIFVFGVSHSPWVQAVVLAMAAHNTTVNLRGLPTFRYYLKHGLIYEELRVRICGKSLCCKWNGQIQFQRTRKVVFGLCAASYRSTKAFGIHWRLVKNDGHPTNPRDHQWPCFYMLVFCHLDWSWSVCTDETLKKPTNWFCPKDNARTVFSNPWPIFIFRRRYTWANRLWSSWTSGMYGFRPHGLDHGHF